MLTKECIREFESVWLPNITDTGLDRLIELLEKGSPLLIHGCFTRAMPMGCLASHIAWHHPHTGHLNQDAGVVWLSHVAGLNPATSHVIHEWDGRGGERWELRSDLLSILTNARDRRQGSRKPALSADPGMSILSLPETGPSEAFTVNSGT